MNKYVQEYLEKKNALKKEKMQNEIQKVINRLKIGEREDLENARYNPDYPLWDPDKGKYYRYNAGEISNEEYQLLIQDFVEKPERSGWFTFATAIMIISGIGLIILIILSIIEENAIFFLIGLGEFLMISLFCGIVQLLTDIKQGIYNLQNKL